MSVLSCLIVIGVLGCIQPCASRAAAAILYSLVGLLCLAVVPYIPDQYYFLSAALADLLFIILASGISPVSRLAVWLSGLAAAGIIVNMFGYINWLSGGSAVLYNWSFFVIYVLAMLASVSGSGEDGTCKRRGRWYSCISFDSGSWFGRVMENVHKAKS